MRLAFVLAAAPLLSLTACAGSGAGSSQPIFKFPTRQELAAIPETPLTPGRGAKTVRVDRWEVQPPGGDPSKDTRPTQWLASIDGKLRPSPALACAARELARFVLKHEGMPTAGLQRFMLGRCGSVRLPSEMVFVPVTGPADAPEDSVVATALPKLKPAAARAESEGGVGVAREGDRAVVGLLTASVEADLTAPAAPAADATSVAVTGTLRTAGELVVGLVNQGATGVASCARDMSVPLPKFSLQCPLAADDASTWIEVAWKSKDALLAHIAGQLLVVRENATVAYVASTVGAPAVVTTREQFASVVASRLNEVRASAKLRPLELVAAQSRVNGRLAAALVSAIAQGDEPSSNRLALGLVAGWEVGRTIRDGDILASLSPATNDAAAWLGDALEYPIGRAVLLGPRWRYVAVGPAISESGGLAAAITTYATFEGVDHREDAKKAFAVIAGYRAARGLPPPLLVRSLPPLDDAIARIGKGEQPGDVVDDLLKGSVHELQAGVRLFTFEVFDPEGIVPPPELLGGGRPELAIGVAHHTLPGAPWGQTVIFVVMVDSAPNRNTAEADVGGGRPRVAAR